MGSFATEDRQNAPPERQEFPLVGGRVPILPPTIGALFTAFFVLLLLSRFLPDWGEQLLNLLSFGVSIITIVVWSFAARRRLPDRLWVTEAAVEFARGARVVARVQLGKLSEIDEFESTNGKVLLLSDNRRMLAVQEAHLADPRSYPRITQAIVEAVGRLDPSGHVARTAVESARLRETVSQQPIRVVPLLAGFLALSSIMAFSARAVIQGEPFPLIDLGALSAPLVKPEAWRVVSYVFQHETPLHLLLCLMGLLWLGSYLEQRVGGERVLLAFFAGVVGGAAGQLYLRTPIPALGANGGICGLIGLLFALTLVGRRLPRAVRPGTFIWSVALFVTLLFVDNAYLQRFAIEPLSRLGLLAGFVLGFVVGVAMLAGVALPVPRESRREWRWFAWVAAFALLVGFVGGVTHHSRGSHRDDNEIVTRSFLNLPHDLQSAVLQRNLAYEQLSNEKASQETIDIAERLAAAAVDNSDRQVALILDTLAVARYKQGDADDAKALIEEALKLSPEGVALAVLKRHLEDISSGSPLRPDPVTSEPGWF